MGAYGYRGQLGFGEEAQYGEAAAITKFCEFKSESVKRSIEESFSGNIRATPNELVNQRLQGRTDIAGDLVMEACLNGQGLLWKHALGSVESTKVGVSTAHRHVFTCAEDLPVGLTLEIGRDKRAFTYAGVRIAQLAMRQNDSGALELTWSVKGKSETLAPAPTLATYPATNRLIGVGLDVTFKIGGVTYYPTSFDTTLINHLDEGCYGFGRTRRQLPFMGREVTGSVTVDFDDQTVYDMFVAGTPAALELKYVGNVIEAGFNEEFLVSLPCVLFNGETPNIGGREAIRQVLPFRAVAENAAGQPLQVEIQNTETAI